MRTFCSTACSVSRFFSASVPSHQEMRSGFRSFAISSTQARRWGFVVGRSFEAIAGVFLPEASFGAREVEARCGGPGGGRKGSKLAHDCFPRRGPSASHPDDKAGFPGAPGAVYVDPAWPDAITDR